VLVFEIIIFVCHTGRYRLWLAELENNCWGAEKRPYASEKTFA